MLFYLLTPGPIHKAKVAKWGRRINPCSYKAFSSTNVSTLGNLISLATIMSNKYRPFYTTSNLEDYRPCSHVNN